MFENVKEKLNSGLKWLQGFGKKVIMFLLVLSLIIFSVFLVRGCTKKQQLDRKQFFSSFSGLDRRIVFDGPTEKRVWLTTTKIEVESSCIRFMDDDNNVVLVGDNWYAEEVDNLKELKSE